MKTRIKSAHFQFGNGEYILENSWSFIHYTPVYISIYSKTKSKMSTNLSKVDEVDKFAFRDTGWLWNLSNLRRKWVITLIIDGAPGEMMKLDRMKILSDAMIVFFCFWYLVALLSKCACVEIILRSDSQDGATIAFVFSPKHSQR